jgi:Uma2 family endonuclease
MSATSPEMLATMALAVPVQRLRMSYEEYLAWADEDVHAEWVNGEVIVHMPPKKRHQELATFLTSLLLFFTRLFRLGTLLAAPFEMRAIPDGPAREPDLLFIAQDHLDRLTEHRLSGPADIVVEIVSDDSVARDRAEKFYEYQAAGIPEYWILDPRPGRERTDFYVLDEHGRYRAMPLDAEGRYHSTVLPGFWLREAWVVAAEVPDPLQALAQVVGPQKLSEALGLEDTTGRPM